MLSMPDDSPAQARPTSVSPRRRVGWLTLSALGMSLIAILSATGALAARSVTTTDVAIVRAEPDLEGPVLILVQRGQPLRIESEPGPWMTVTTLTGERGFVAGRIDGASLTPDESLAPPPKVPSAFLTVPLGAPLRVSPALGSRPSGELAPGSTVRAFERHGLWLSIATADGRAGWLELGRSAVARATEADFAQAAAAADAATAAAEPSARPAGAPRHDTPSEGADERAAYRHEAAAKRTAAAEEDAEGNEEEEETEHE